MTKNSIFICYRRSDASSAQLVVERLRRVFGENAVFQDTGGIEYGEDYLAVLLDAVKSGKAFIPIIGRGFVEELPRLHDGDDVLGQEIATALERGPAVRIIPVCMGGAGMPAATQLPPPCAGLSRLNALEIPQRFFNIAMSNSLVPDLRVVLDIPEPLVRRWRKSIFGGAVAASFAVLLAFQQYRDHRQAQEDWLLTPRKMTALAREAHGEGQNDLAAWYALYAWPDQDGAAAHLAPREPDSETFRVLAAARPDIFLGKRKLDFDRDGRWIDFRYVPEQEAFFIAVEDGREIKRWDTATGKTRTVVLMPRRPVYNFWVLGTDPVRLGLFGIDGSLAVWSAAEGRVEYGRSTGRVHHMDFLGDVLHVAGQGGLWKFPAPDEDGEAVSPDRIMDSVIAMQGRTVFTSQREVILVGRRDGEVTRVPETLVQRATAFRGEVLLRRHGEEGITVVDPADRSQRSLLEGRRFDGMVAAPDDSLFLAWEERDLLIFTDLNASPRNPGPFEKDIEAVSLSLEGDAVVAFDDGFLTVLKAPEFVDSAMRWPVPESKRYLVTMQGRGLILPRTGDTGFREYLFSDEPLKALRESLMDFPRRDPEEYDPYELYR